MSFACIIALSACELLSVPQQHSSSSSVVPTKEAEANAAVENTVAYDNGGVSVAITGLKNNESLEFAITSDIDDAVTFLIDDVAVNGCMVYDDGSYSKYVTKGSKCLDSYDLSGMKAYGIKKIKTIDVTFSLFIASEIKTVSTHLTTSLDDGTAFEPSFEGAEMCFKDENVEVYTIRKGKGLTDFELLFHNLTDHPMSSYFTHISVNGIMVENMDFWGDGAFPKGWCYTGATNGATYTVWSALEDEIKERGFDNVSSITGSLGVWLHDKAGEKDIKQYDVNTISIYPIKTQ
jgi:hypothetical protein